MNAFDRRFKRGPVAAAVDEMQRVGAGRPRKPAGGITRRQLLKAGAAGAVFGGLPFLAACGGDDGDAQPAPQPPSRTETRTFFFDHSHLDHAGKAMALHVGMKRHPLRPVAESPEVLRRERATNAFLAAVPDSNITHTVENVEIDSQYTTVAYVYTADTADPDWNGEWTMDSVHVMLPQSSAPVAFQRIVATARDGHLPRSHKRRKYGVVAAASAQDLHDEQALLDTSSHAATLIACHKDMLALDAGAAATVINQHVMNTSAVEDLDDELSTIGTATPEVTPGKANPGGWATLRPVVNKTTGQPFTMDTDKRVCYMPVLHPNVARLVGQGVKDALPQVQDNEALGADVTSKPDPSTLHGVLWTRRDGKPNVVQAAKPTAAASQAPTMGTLWPNGSNHWLECDATATLQSGGAQQIDISYGNSGLRYLSAYVEFENEAGQLLEWSTFGSNFVSSPPNFSTADQASNTRLRLGGIAAVGTVMGVPVILDQTFWGSMSISMTVPQSVHKIRLLAGGLGSGSNNYPDTIAGGVAGTMLMCYCVNTIFAALGAIPNMDAVYGAIVSIVGTFLSDVAAAMLDEFSGNQWLTAQFWIDQGMNLINLVIGMFSAYGVEPTIKAFATAFAAALGEAIAEEAVKNAVWFVGIALNIESAVAGAVDFAITTTSCAQSPFTYVTELVFTHDVTVTINADPADDAVFPEAANAFQVTATFDDGKPWKSDWLPNPGGGSTTYTFTGVPYGGNVTFEAVFVQRALDGSDADNIQLGRGSTGKVPNDDATVYVIAMTDQEFPIGPTSVYRHQKRTYLDGSNRHVWVEEAAPTALPTSFACGGPNEICSRNGIAVRQGNGTDRTMLAYAWRGQNPGGGGDVEQIALANAEDPGIAYSVTAVNQSGAGLTVALSRDSGGANNYYVDTSGGSRIIRGVNFPRSGNPSLDSPGSNSAFGVLNLPSSALLVHPSGALVSVAGSSGRLEVLTPPDAAVPDAEAGQKYVAQVLGLDGKRVGCMSSVVGATIANDGTLLVLEGGLNNRIQAFDLGMNPVRYFPNAATPYFLQLGGLEASAGWRHLDVQADFTGLLYVLSFNTGSNVYQLTIYDSLSKTQRPLSTTQQIYAARIGLDHWRNLYTLNYQPITVQNSTVVPAITEPSVSLWTPCNAGQTCPV